MKDKKALVVGMGRSGIAAAYALINAGIKVSVQDSKQKDAIDPEALKIFEAKGIDMFFGSVPEDMSSFDSVVVSPGVPTDLGFIKEAKAGGAEIIGELELAYRLGKGSYAAITGTNGKTTTTTLTGEMFKAAGRTTHVVGNIGVAVVSKAAQAEDEDWLVTEVSSFQLETIDEFHPKVSALLNLTPDHLDRHKTFENYIAAKARVFENQTKEDYAVLNFDDPLVMKLAPEIEATVVPFSRVEELPFGAFVKNGDIVIRDHDEKLITFCAADDLLIPGTHNLENALAATAVAWFAGVDKEAITKALTTFAGVEHRIEDCGTVDGVKYINDSKGTNPDAAIKAIEAIKENIILIAGGYDKGSDFTEFVEAFDGRVKHVILLGTTAVKIKDAAEKAGFTATTIVKDMDDCVKEAARLAKEGDNVLLSPACASWDMYGSYEERGRHFKKCVEELRK